MKGIEEANGVRSPEDQLQEPRARDSTLAEIDGGAIQIVGREKVVIAKATEEAAQDMLERLAERASWNIASGLPLPNFHNAQPETPDPEDQRASAASDVNDEQPEGRAVRGVSAPAESGEKIAVASLRGSALPEGGRQTTDGDSSAQLSGGQEGSPPRSQFDGTSPARKLQANDDASVVRNEDGSGESTDSEAGVPIKDRSMQRAEARYSTFEIPKVCARFAPVPLRLSKQAHGWCLCRNFCGK